jgi:hypothetical protein
MEIIKDIEDLIEARARWYAKFAGILIGFSITIAVLIVAQANEEMATLPQYSYSLAAFIYSALAFFSTYTWYGRAIENWYLFSWDKVPGNDSAKLQKFLKEDLNIDWVENAEIHKSIDGKTIFISKDEKSAEIIIDTEEDKATLKINEDRTHDLKVKNVEGKQNIFETSEKQKCFRYASLFYYTGYWSLMLGLVYLTSLIQPPTLNYAFFIPLAFLVYTFIVNLRESMWEIRGGNKLNGIILLVLLILFIIISVLTIPKDPFLALLRVLN